jgi:hypothetical protein
MNTFSKSNMMSGNVISTARKAFVYQWNLRQSTTNLLIASVWCFAASLAHAASETPPNARELHAAQCVAALEVNTEDLASAVKSGKEELRPVLLSRLESGISFVGDTYLHDDQDEKRARALANAALDAQKNLSEAELAALQTSCSDEGAKLLANANGIERALVKRAANRRMEKLLSR